MKCKKVIKKDICIVQILCSIVKMKKHTRKENKTVRKMKRKGKIKVSKGKEMKILTDRGTIIK
jgi:hypothetical protein